MSSPTSADVLERERPIAIEGLGDLQYPAWYRPISDESFAQHDPYAIGEEHWWCANRSRLAWKVVADGDALRIERLVGPSLDELPIAASQRASLARLFPVAIHKLPKGWMFAAQDERGASSVWWISADGAAAKFVSAQHVIGFVVLQDGLVAVIGSSYGMHQEGQLVRFSQSSDGEWTSQIIADIGQVPRAIHKIDERRLLIVTPQELIEISETGAMRTLHFGSWVALAPNSIATHPGGTIHIGMRHGIVRLVPSDIGYSETWLVPERCDESLEHCSCRP